MLPYPPNLSEAPGMSIRPNPSQSDSLPGNSYMTTRERCSLFSFSLYCQECDSRTSSNCCLVEVHMNCGQIKPVLRKKENHSQEMLSSGMNPWIQSRHLSASHSHELILLLWYLSQFECSPSKGKYSHMPWAPTLYQSTCWGKNSRIEFDMLLTLQGSQLVWETSIKMPLCL